MSVPSRKKIAIVANTTWNIYNFRLNIVKLLIKKGFEVTVIAPVDEYIAPLSHIAGLTYIPLRHLSRKSTNPLRDLLLLKELYRIYRKTKPDLVLHYTIKPNIFGNFAASLAGIKSICIVTGLGYAFLHAGIVKKITTQLYRWSFQRSEKIIFENEDDCRLFSNLGISPAQKSISVKGCGVNTDFFAPAAKSQNVSKNKKFIFIGRLLHDKGIFEYVEAARLVKEQYPDTIFEVLGAFDEENPANVAKEKLAEWIENEIIDYLGSTKDVRNFIANADCVVLPSYREGLPRVILEAMAMAKPVITTDTAGCRETVISNKNGFLVPVKDAKALSKAMIEFCSLPPSEIESMSNVSRDQALNVFDDQIIANNYLKIIEKILLLHL